MSPSMTADYYYKVGIGLARFGQVTRAKDAFTAGLSVAETHKLNAWYFKIEDALTDLASSPVEQPPTRAVSELSEDPAVHEMVVGLREYAESTAT